MASWAQRRERMVRRQIEERGVRDPRVLAAMRTVPRELFVPPDQVPWSYADRPLPLAEGSTISQPYVVAWMAEAARIGPTDRVLEVGTGSGYGAAVLAELAGRVHTIECLPEVAEQARRNLARWGSSVVVHVGDGTLGLAGLGPWDAVVVTAAGPHVPRALVDQLADGGRLVIPVGTRQDQRLVRVVRTSHGTAEGAPTTRPGEETFTTRTEELGTVRFVPLLGEQGWVR